MKALSGNSMGALMLSYKAQCCVNGFCTCRHPLLLVEWLKKQAGLKRSSTKPSGGKSVSLRQLGNRKENMSDGEDQTSDVSSYLMSLSAQCLEDTIG